jgi:CRP/FNR family transcriptional regulator, cyclic AMP receptor protein
MTVRPSDLRTIPLLTGITDEHLTALTGAFERLTVGAGEVLFEAGSVPTHLWLLVSGEVALQDPGATGEPRFRLNPIAPIGELGAVTGTRRSTTAVTTQPSEIWRIGVGALSDFFEAHGDVAFPFYHNLLSIVADKVRRDSRRIDEMRTNLIRTQKRMKRMLEAVLESEETPLSRELAETLEDLIEHNRRIHYMVGPTRGLASVVRLDGGALLPVQEISDGLLRLAKGDAALEVGSEWSGVLVTPGGEVPVSGKVEAGGEDGAVIRLDLLIEQYAAILRDYLTRVQMLDFVV